MDSISKYGTCEGRLDQLKSQINKTGMYRVKRSRHVFASPSAISCNDDYLAGVYNLPCVPCSVLANNQPLNINQL
jgi:hypothetical protein